ncbi:MAG: hypothetical protein HQK54_00120 [Oligoflexales bacterium]|nr:hypothetical protein [Oligoflexales bacterium]
MRKLIVVFAIASILTACGSKKGDDQPTVITTPLDGDWGVFATRKLTTYEAVCDTKFIVGNSKALLAETCGDQYQIYHVIAFGTLKVSLDEFEIQTEVACPASEISYPATKGKFAFSTDSGNLKRLSLTAADNSKTTTMIQVTRELEVGSAKAGCLSSDFIVIPNPSWQYIADFAKGIINPYGAHID